MAKEKFERLFVGAFVSVLCATIACLSLTPAAFASPLELEKAPKIYAGPYQGDVVRVIDSDTVKVRVHMWPGQSIETNVRILGVDTPEKFRPQCDLERAKAKTATAFVENLLPINKRVEVLNVQNGKFAGRVVGDIRIRSPTGGDTIAAALIRRQFAVPYFGGKKTKDWCE